MYDAISDDYDKFVNWPNRLAVEIPFIQDQLKKFTSHGGRILDAACGTGMHTIALAQDGFHMAGADLSTGMIERARKNARSVGASIHFEAAGFGDLASTFPEKPFDALLCLGNSIPHLPDLPAIEHALTDFAECLRPGGLLLLQNRNFDAVLSHRERWMEPQAYQQDNQEWLFLRFYDFDADNLLSFHMVTLKRQGGSPWKQEVTTTRLYPLRQVELVQVLERAGFEKISSYGSMSDTPYVPGSSPNLVIVAERK